MGYLLGRETEDGETRRHIEGARRGHRGAGEAGSRVGGRKW